VQPHDRGQLPAPQWSASAANAIARVIAAASSSVCRPRRISFPVRWGAPGSASSRVSCRRTSCHSQVVAKANSASVVSNDANALITMPYAILLATFSTSRPTEKFGRRWNRRRRPRALPAASSTECKGREGNTRRSRERCTFSESTCVVISLGNIQTQGPNVVFIRGIQTRSMNYLTKFTTSPRGRNLRTNRGGLIQARRMLDLFLSGNSFRNAQNYAYLYDILKEASVIISSSSSSCSLV